VPTPGSGTWTWKLLDAAGNSVGLTTDSDSGELTATLNSTAHYILVATASDTNTASDTLQFTCRTGVSLGNRLSGTLYTSDSYSLQLDHATDVLFNLVQEGNYVPELTISLGSTTIYSGYASNNALLPLGAGIYTITITNSNRWYVTTYALDMIDAGQAAPLAASDNSSGTAAQGAAQVRRFQAKAGQIFQFTGSTSGTWRVYDAFGRQMTSSDLSSLPRSGDYTLVWDSSVASYGATTTTPYALSFTLTDPVLPLALDAPIALTFPASETATYSFDITQSGLYWLDQISGSVGSAKVVDARGVTVFDCSDFSHGMPGISLGAGSYTLVLGEQRYNSTITFQLKTLANATALAFDADVSSGAQTGAVAYQFDLDQASNFLLAHGDSPSATWTLIGPYARSYRQAISILTTPTRATPTWPR